MNSNPISYDSLPPYDSHYFPHFEDDCENDPLEHSMGSPEYETISDQEDYGINLELFNQNSKRPRHDHPHSTPINPSSMTFKVPSLLPPSSLPASSSPSSSTPPSDTTIIDQNSEPQVPPKRKRGRPPGKKKQAKDSIDSFSFQSLNRDENQNYSTGSGFSHPQPPVKRGRGRPRKYPLPNANTNGTGTPVANDLNNSISTRPPIDEGPSDYEIIKFIKDLIVQTSRCESERDSFFFSRESDKESDHDEFINNNAFIQAHPFGDPNSNLSSESRIDLDWESPSSPSPGSSPGFLFPSSAPSSRPTTPINRNNKPLTLDVILKKLEEHYGIDLAYRKHFLCEVLDVLSA